MIDLTCKICSNRFDSPRSFSTHIQTAHSMKLQAYYDEYEKQSNEGICVVCGKPTSFYGFRKSTPYLRTCSRKCSSLDSQHWEHYRQANLKKYNETNYTKTAEYKARRASTKQNKFSLMTKFEKLVYKELCQVFDDVQFSYLSSVYPWECDFYIPSIDTYLECNNFWTHGPHRFDAANYEDQQLVKLWKLKSNQSYQNAIQIWTIDDVQKVKIANENHLNYVTVYTYNDFQQWFSTIRGGK